MESRAKFLGHSIHQQLVMFPLGLLGAAVLFDLIHIVTDLPTMALVAYWLIVGGLVGGLIAAPFGTVDWLAIPAGTRAKRIGMAHGLSNVLTLLLFGASWSLRVGNELEPGVAAHVFSFAGAGVSLLGAWLGGELVSRLGVSIYDGAHLNSPSSISDRPATDSVASSR